MKIKFATWVANGQSLQPQGASRRGQVATPIRKRRLGKPGGVEFNVRIVSGDKAETGGGHGAGLARHGLSEALTLQSGRQVHFAAGEQAGKELHHPSPLFAQTGRLRLRSGAARFCCG
ncbi:hypothetical protein MPL3365_30468 [Mesorhizobium plurifarium]|uniref:Uncharacterized protein n=1 Tax=Mesorhizobium plurifarium TaxID=69974 RepID=A0A090GEL1_MESPL|nr:hypothetical protein MPL3365_30468 [Mesorhizobium plurifarium]